MGPAPLNTAIQAIADTLAANEVDILAANNEDKQAATSSGVVDSLYKVTVFVCVKFDSCEVFVCPTQRLDLSGDKFKSLVASVGEVVALPDPVGVVTLATQLDDGLDLYRVSCPIGVICVIFEARPEAAVRRATLLRLPCWT